MRMAATFTWYDESKRIVIVSVYGDWSREALANYTKEFWPQMAQLPHTVDIVVDLRQGGLLPMQPIMTLIWLAKNRPENAGRVVFIVKRALGLALARTLNMTMQKLYPRFHISGVLTLEEAIQYLTPASIDETAEVPTSSLAEAGSQLPSGSQQ